MKAILILWLTLWSVILIILLSLLFVQLTADRFLWSAKLYAKYINKDIWDRYLQVKNAKSFKYYETFNEYYYDENKNEDVVWYMDAFWSKDEAVLIVGDSVCNPLYIDLCKQHNIPIK